MDWKKLLSDLDEAGLTQAAIAAHCGVAQSTVSDLGRGATLTPRFDFGQKLIALHGESCANASQSKAPEEAREIGAEAASPTTPPAEASHGALVSEDVLRRAAMVHIRQHKRAEAAARKALDEA